MVHCTTMWDEPEGANDVIQRVDMLYEHVLGHCNTVNIICLVCSIAFCTCYPFIYLIFFLVQHFIYVLFVVAFGISATSACIMSSPYHHTPPVLHPCLCLLWLLPPSSFRSPEHWAHGGWAIWARPPIPPSPLIPPQTPPHRTAGRQRQVNYPMRWMTRRSDRHNTRWNMYITYNNQCSNHATKG